MMKYFSLLLTSFFSVWVYGQSSPNYDGPYVFYKENSVEVVQFSEGKSFQKENFASVKGKELICKVDSVNSFSVKIKENINTEPSEYQMPKKLIAISDIEGRFYEFREFLINNKVIDEDYNWRFGKGHLVLNGDFFDRGKYVTQCLWLIYKLEQEAEKHGGKVHFILGNHDLMNMYGNTKYVHKKYLQNADNLGVDYPKMFDENTELGRWLQSKNIIEKIGNYLFTHAGISPELADLQLSISEINQITRPHYFSLNKSRKTNDPKLNVLLSSKLSPYWYRGIARSEIAQNQVDKILTQFNASKLIIGHTLTENVAYLYNKKVINIDTNHAKGNSQGLFIKNQKKEYKIDIHGNKTSIN